MCVCVCLLLWLTQVALMLRTGAVLDEFTSDLDRGLARRVCEGVSRFVRGTALHGVVLVTCHTDVMAFLRPDWVFHTPSERPVVAIY